MVDRSVRSGFVLSNVISSQVPIHRKFGGVVPEIASRHHIEQVIPVIDQALRDANVTLQEEFYRFCIDLDRGMCSSCVELEGPGIG